MAFPAAKRRMQDEQGGRFYDIDGALLPSVTNILNCIGKPALIGWAAKTEREHCLQAACDLYGDIRAGIKPMDVLVYRSTLEARIGKQKAHQRELAKAGEIGTQVHALIEWNIRRDLGLPVKAQPVVSDRAQWAFMAFEDWRKAHEFQPVVAEQVVWSREHGYAGTMDVLGAVTLPGVGRVQAVVDWKTGSRIYDEAMLQNAAYVTALLEMGHAEPPVHGVIVRFPKVETDPDFEVKHVHADEHPELLRVFLAARDLWRWGNRGGA